MMWLIGFVGSKVGRLVASALAALATILLVFNAGRRDMKKDLQVKDLKDYKKVKEAEDATTVTSARTDVLCGLDTPTFTESELNRLSAQSLEELDNFLEKRRAICGA